ncbi:late competence protein ComER [Paenibacillus senegalensis]|uniref:late competence protein ComER n=1 Tax=Paenibacillus senegalensis TaxID=1465766 RepID=UPI000289B15A|nr:late competence protein ComER [Paenibacillus senegalensis]
MNTGFIGTGSMGSLLIESFIKSDALLPQEITASNRNPAKVAQLAERYPGLRAVPSNREVALESELIFLCVRPMDIFNVINDIQPYIHPDQYVISITSPVMIQQLESRLPCRVAKLIPSITNYMLDGAMLCVYGSRISSGDRERIEQLIRRISEPIEISETHVRVCSDLSSCGPAFFAYLLEQFAHAAVEETGIDYEQACTLASRMLLGTGKLLTEGGFTPEQLRQRVTVPGGITAEGLKIIEKELTGKFNQLFQMTHHKFTTEVTKVTAQWST